MTNEQMPKNWNAVKSNDSWAIFKIMGEFVSGYEKMSRIGPCVSIFGSARTKPDDKNYKLAESIAKRITEIGRASCRERVYKRVEARECKSRENSTVHSP